MSGVDLARLAIVFDTSSAPAAISSMQQVANQSRTVGASVDKTTQSINTHNQALAQGGRNAGAFNAAAQQLRHALDEEARAAAAVTMGHDKRFAAITRAFAKEREAYQQGALSAREYANRLQGLQGQVDKMGQAQMRLAGHGKDASQSMMLLTGAVGGFFGAFTLQAMSAIGQFGSFIAGLPGDLAHAGDELERLNARLTFAFRGSSEAARAAREDIIAIARQSGVPYSQVAQGYGDIAIAGRGPGLTRGQIGGLTGAFSMLGQMTGADNASTGRAMWQFQQALALGRLTSQDYRFMATNMPAIDDALAAGMGVDVNTIPARISRGEIDANKMVEALIRGVDILKQSAGGLPETMERGRGRIQTEWELLLSNMEERIQSSDLWQSIMNGLAGGLRATNQSMSSDPSQRLAGLQYQLAREAHPLQRAALERQIEEAQAAAARVRSGPDITSLSEAARERAMTRRSLIGRGQQTADLMSSLELQRGEARQNVSILEAAVNAAQAPMGAGDISVLRARDRALAAQGVSGTAPDRMAIRGALNSGTTLPPEQIERLSTALSVARAQLNDLISSFERMGRQVQEASGDLNSFGAGGGFDIAQSARGVMAQARAQGVLIDMSAARGLILNQRMVGVENTVGGMSFANETRQGVVDAAGGDVTERRRAALDAEAAGFFRQNFGRREDLSGEQASRADALTERYRRERATEFAQGDAQNLRERERADRERLDAMRAQIEMGVQLGQQGRVALAQAERERELRREFPQITEDLVSAERARVAELVRASEQLDYQQQQMARLADTAQTIGRSAGEAFSAGIIQSIREGKGGFDAVLGSLQRSAERVLTNLMDAAFAPYERRLTEMASGGLNQIFGGNGQGLGELDKAVADSASKIALNTKASMSETAAHQAATTNVLGFSKAVMAATAALQTMSASSAASSGSDWFSTFVGALGGGGGTGGGAHGGVTVPAGKGGGAKMSAAPVVQIIDQRSGNAAPIEAQESTGPDGERMVKVIVRGEVKQSIASGAVNREMRTQFGAAPRVKVV